MSPDGFEVGPLYGGNAMTAPGRAPHLEPVADLGARLADELEKIERDVPVAVLPQGPTVIP